MRITTNNLNVLQTVRHGFFTRAGGVSEAPFDSLNCGYGSGDDLEKVKENRTRAMAAFEAPSDCLCTLNQVHSSRVVAVGHPWSAEETPEADAMVTKEAGLALGILTADCGPVLFADPEAGVIGAAHAGWKGALGGILEHTLQEMLALGARLSRIHAALGPCIGQASYEVGPEFRDRFVHASPAHNRFFIHSHRAGHWLFDLKGFIAHRLRSSGLASVDILPHDTLAEPERFFSYRRHTLAGETRYGRQLSAIMRIDSPDTSV